MPSPSSCAQVRKHPSHRYKDLFLADADGSNLSYLAPFVTHPSWHPSESRFYLFQSQRNAFAPGLEPGRPKPVYQQRTSGSRAGLPGRYRMIEGLMITTHWEAPTWQAFLRQI